MSFVFNKGNMKVRQKDGTKKDVQVLVGNTKEAIDAINEEGLKQVSEIEKKGKEFADKIPDDYDALKEDVNTLKQELANVGKPTDEQISTAVREYLSGNPVFNEEKDPTVSEWAKKELGTGLTISYDGKLTVDIAESVEEDNTKPVTSGAVYTVLGNIETLLSIL